MKPTKNGHTDQASMEELFNRQQQNHAVSIPKQTGVVSAQEQMHQLQMMQQANQNVLSQNMQKNQQDLILTQAMKEQSERLRSMFERIDREDNDWEFTESWEIG